MLKYNWNFRFGLRFKNGAKHRLNQVKFMEDRLQNILGDRFVEKDSSTSNFYKGFAQILFGPSCTVCLE